MNLTCLARAERICDVEIKTCVAHQAEIYNARLQLVILSPLLLSWVLQHPAQLAGRLLQQDRVIAILLGVTEEQVTPEHRYRGAGHARAQVDRSRSRQHSYR